MQLRQRLDDYRLRFSGRRVLYDTVCSRIMHSLSRKKGKRVGLVNSSELLDRIRVNAFVKLYLSP